MGKTCSNFHFRAAVGSLTQEVQPDKGSVVWWSGSTQGPFEICDHEFTVKTIIVVSMVVRFPQDHAAPQVGLQGSK